MFLLLTMLLSCLVFLFVFAVKSATRASRRKSPRKQTKKRSVLLGLGLCVGAFTIIFCVCLGWFFMDDFLMYTLYIDRDVEMDDSDIYSNYSFTSDPYSFASADGLPGYSGVTAMYVGTRGGSYYKEYLEILKDTCNGSLIPDGYFTANSANFPNGRSDWYSVPIYGIMGMNIAETGTNSDKIGPRQFMDVEHYNESTGWTLSNYNSGFIKAQGLSSLDNGFYLTGRLDSGTGAIRGPFQFSYNFFDVFVEKPSGWGGSGTRFWPSTMNGYGFQEGVQRQGRTVYQDKNGQLDMFYFPDIVAAACEYAHYNLGGSGGNPVLKTITPDAFAIGTGAMHAYGEAGMSRYQLGGLPSGESKRSCATVAWNYVADLWGKSRDYAYAHGDDDDVKVNWYTQRTWLGWTSTLMLLDGGIVRDSKSLTNLKNMANGTSPFSRGALLAYRAVKGDGATMDDVKSYYQGLSITNIDNSVYGNHIDYKEFTIYLASKTLSTGGHAVYYRWDSQSLYESGSLFIIGPYAYRNVLAACGVEASIQDCYNDPSGELISKIVLRPAILDSDEANNPNSYYYGSRQFVSYVPGSNNLTKQTSCMYWRVISISKGIHFGEDFGKTPSQLAAIAEADVIKVGSDPDGWGNYTQFEVTRSNQSEPKIVYLYAHQKEIKTTQGSHISPGDIVGIPGTTGNSTGVHLHLEFWVYNDFDGETVRSCMSFRSIYEGLYTPATGPRVRRINSGAMTNKTACIVYSGVGENLGLLSTITDQDYPANAKSEPVETAGLNYFMNAALNSYAMAKGAASSGAIVDADVTEAQVQKILSAARSKIGMPYCWGGQSDSKGYDCSGLVQYAYMQAGLSIPRTASEQRKATAQIAINQVHAGDFIFWHKNVISMQTKSEVGEEGGSAHHVGIVTGVTSISAAGIKYIDSDKWSASGMVGQDGTMEQVLSDVNSSWTVNSGGMYLERTDSNGVKHYITFGRYVG